MKLFIDFILIAAFVSLSSCKMKRLKSLGNFEFGSTSANSTINELADFTPKPAVNGEDLVTSDFKVGPYYVGSYQALQLSAKADERADYLEYQICSDNPEIQCVPKGGGIFVVGSHVYPDPPSDLIKVRIRSCVRSYNATNPSKNCGPWKTLTYLQQENFKGKVHQALLSQYQSLNSIRKKCGDIRNAVLQYKKHISELNDPKLTEERKAFIKMANNTINIGEDNICQMILSDQLSIHYEQLKQEQAASSKSVQTRESQNLTKTLAILTVFAAAIALAGYSLNKAARVDGIERSLKALLVTQAYTTAQMESQMVADLAEYQRISSNLAKAEHRAVLAQMREQWRSFPDAETRLTKLDAIVTQLETPERLKNVVEVQKGTKRDIESFRRGIAQDIKTKQDLAQKARNARARSGLSAILLGVTAVLFTVITDETKLAGETGQSDNYEELLRDKITKLFDEIQNETQTFIQQQAVMTEALALNEE